MNIWNIFSVIFLALKMQSEISLYELSKELATLEDQYRLKLQSEKIKTKLAKYNMIKQCFTLFEEICKKEIVFPESSSEQSETFESHLKMPYDCVKDFVNLYEKMFELFSITQKTEYNFNSSLMNLTFEIDDNLKNNEEFHKICKKVQRNINAILENNK